MSDIEYIRDDLLEHLCRKSLADLIELQNTYLEIGLLAQDWSIDVSSLDQILDALIDLQLDPEYTGCISSVGTLKTAARDLLNYRYGYRAAHAPIDHDSVGESL